MKKTMTIFCMTLVTALAGLGCKDDKAAAPAPLARAPQAGHAEHAAGVTHAEPHEHAEPKDAAKKGVDAPLAAYEALRAALAADQLPKVPGMAERVVATANAARAGASAQTAGRLSEMAAAGATLKAGASPHALRRGFGELSRAVVALIAENTALAQGRHVFHCPMAQGYKKWVQTSKELENPYMGQKMLRCGTASDWKP